MPPSTTAMRGKLPLGTPQPSHCSHSTLSVCISTEYSLLLFSWSLLNTFHSTLPNGRVESTSWNSACLVVRHHFNISNTGPSNHPRIMSNPTYHTSSERGEPHGSCGHKKDDHKTPKPQNPKTPLDRLTTKFRNKWFYFPQSYFTASSNGVLSVALGDVAIFYSLRFCFSLLLYWCLSNLALDTTRGLSSNSDWFPLSHNIKLRVGIENFRELLHFRPMISDPWGMSWISHSPPPPVYHFSSMIKCPLLSIKRKPHICMVYLNTAILRIVFWAFSTLRTVRGYWLFSESWVSKRGVSKPLVKPS